jgi:hypothetical protein
MYIIDDIPLGFYSWWYKEGYTKKQMAFLLFFSLFPFGFFIVLLPMLTFKSFERISEDVISVLSSLPQIVKTMFSRE